MRWLRSFAGFRFRTRTGRWRRRFARRRARCGRCPALFFLLARRGRRRFGGRARRSFFLSRGPGGTRGRRLGWSRTRRGLLFRGRRFLRRHAWFRRRRFLNGRFFLRVLARSRRGRRRENFLKLRADAFLGRCGDGEVCQRRYANDQRYSKHSHWVPERSTSVVTTNG